MQRVNLSHNGTDPIQNILCLGAHSDDIEIGCGGSLLRLIEENPNLTVWWVVFSVSNSGLRRTEALRSADLFLAQTGQKNVMVQDFRDGYLPYQGADVKDFFEVLKKQVSPDLIFTHYRHDLHQDHRMINELTWNTWRDHMILEYEIPKFDGDLGNPNFYIPLERKTCQQKSEILCEVFQTQGSKPWFAGETFWSLLQIRGIECRAPENLAEAFYARKVVV
jgi:LmbE family N-acetylglucosaminyl deacetylase